jgi:hypothetical protein
MVRVFGVSLGWLGESWSKGGDCDSDPYGVKQGEMLFLPVFLSLVFLSLYLMA